MAAQGAFPGMVPLAPFIYLYTPQQQERHPEDEKGGPKIIVLCTWMAAQPTHITKYITSYQTIYPASQILLIRAESVDMIFRSYESLQQRVQAALSVIQSTCSPDPPRPEILLHVFSNGGCVQSISLMQAYRASTGHAFPLHATVFDSCPGRGTFRLSCLAVATPFDRQPFYVRLPALFMVFAAMCAYFLVMIVLRNENPVMQGRRLMNDRGLVKETKRVYMYSDADAMVPGQEVEDHARDSSEQGFRVAMEKFEGSGHVSHVRVGGGKRYWEIVQRFWGDSASKD
ncbi:MAG: hypothetical protein Q9191_004768 [Dirinaria sp. TL-2023a]